MLPSGKLSLNFFASRPESVKSVSYVARRDTFIVEVPETASAVAVAVATVLSETVALRMENFDELPASVNDEAVDCKPSSLDRRVLKNTWRCVSFDCDACSASTAGCRVLRYAAARSSDAFWPSAENPFPTMNVVFVTLVAMILNSSFRTLLYGPEVYAERLNVCSHVSRNSVIICAASSYR